MILSEAQRGSPGEENSQSKLSRKADVSLNPIQAMYHNPYHDAVLSTLDKLAKALGVNVSDLYEVLPDEDEGSGVILYVVSYRQKNTDRSYVAILQIAIFAFISILYVEGGHSGLYRVEPENPFLQIWG